MNTQLKDEVIQMIGDTPVGSQRRVVCPSCGGGSKKERSMSITRRADRIGFASCWRATCDMPNVSYMGTMFIPSGTTHPSARRTCYDGTIVPLPPFVCDGQQDDWGLSEDNRIVIPIRDKDGIRKGDILRQIKPYNNYQPKSLSLYEEGYDGMAWFWPEAYNPDFVDLWDSPAALCLVEDPLSAARLAYEGHIGVALLGTHLSRARMATLASATTGPINVALDADAYMQSVHMARRHRNRIDLRVHRVYNDVKDMDCDELGNFLGVLVV